MPRAYEVVYIFDSTLEDTAIADKLNRLQSLLGATENMQIDHWGRRQLAYKIGPRESAYYVISRFDAEPTVLPEFERALRLEEGVLRYLITLHEHDVGAPLMLDEEFVAGRRRDDDDDDED
jgi:small subunit ribosomal protein S6